MKIAFFGHFGRANFGNDSTFLSILYNLRRRAPNADVHCICTLPETVAADYDVAAVPSRVAIVRPWALRHPLAKLARKLTIGIPSELYRWLKGLRLLWRTNALIIPGTGLLTDVYTFLNWGPYDVFRWSVTAKLCRCKLLFVSVGAGPMYSRIGRFFIKAALSLADFRSYRDESTRRYLSSIGFRTDDDSVYPDLAFSLPEYLIPNSYVKSRKRPIVGLGLMDDPGTYNMDKTDNKAYRAYLDNLVLFVQWLLVHDWDVQLLIGDIVDRPVVQEFKTLLKQRLLSFDEERVIDQPVVCVDDLLSQLGAVELVVATRFHNVLLSLLLNKPVISISFHHKCTSLMAGMGLSEYCLDMNQLKVDRLIELFGQLQENAGILRPMIKQKAERCRKALDDQYGLIFQGLESR